MTATLRHRGPDGEGVWVDADAGVALGNRRLSILDLSAAGSQPMHSACGRYVISTNGEIYNFRSLRAELKTMGAAFTGSSDTEVMLAAISAWGVHRAVRRFNGMFAFALWDRRDRRLHLGRDRIGEKPLYYGWSGKVFLFGSELKALTCHPGFDRAIDRGALALYLRHSYIPAPLSVYQGISKLMAGTVLTLTSGDAEPAIDTYWSAREIAEHGLSDPFPGTAGEAADCLDDLLTDSIKLRMESDRPVGAFLSGGVDSSTLVALMGRATHVPVNTFSIGFEEADEAVYSRRVAAHLGANHTEQYITSADALTVIPRLPHLYDEPFSDSSQIPTFLVSVLARRDVAVILTGDAGDELFCGYRRYALPRQPLPQIHGNGVPNCERIEFYRSRISHWTDPGNVLRGSTEPPSVLGDPAQWLRSSDFREQMMLMDTITYLPDDLLVKLDRAAMGVGLETRTPYLDHRLIEFAWKLPFRMKLNGEVRKWILRRVLYRYVPPALIERPKQGFEIPLFTWLTGGLRDWAESLLDESRIRREGFFHAPAIREKWNLLTSGDRRSRHDIWTILMFEAWLEQRN